MKIYVFIMLLICPIFLTAQENNRILLEKEQSVLLLDLMNKDAIGYKRHLFDNNIFRIDFSQGPLQHTNRILDFAIIGDGFFKLILSDGRTAYTRAGEFTIDIKTNKIMTIDGYFLYDDIIILPGFSTINIDNDNKIIAIYPNGENIICGSLNIFEFEVSELYEENILLKESVIPDFIYRTRGMVVGIRRNSRAMYFYNGNDEKISKSIVVNNYLENSNVEFFILYRKLMEINRLLY